MDIKPIETEYKGYKFRSRLEARWAVFFDALRIRYEYETEGFEWGDWKYLPDFYLPDEDIYVEVKPRRDGALDELWRAIRVMDANKKMLLILRDIPFDNRGNVWWFPLYYHHPVTCDFEGVRVSIGFNKDGSYLVRDWYICMKQRLFGVPVEKNVSEVNDFDVEQDQAFPARYVLEEKELAEAYRKARQARFEHGEKPEVRR